MKFLISILSLSIFAHAGQVFKGYAHFKVKPEFVDQFRYEVGKIIAPTRKEKGCISYEAYQVVNEKGAPINEFVFHEIWKTKNDMMIDHKEKAPHMIHFFSKVKVGEKDSWVESFNVSGLEVNQL